MTKRTTISRDASEADNYWTDFVEYAKLETGTGGPDPHMKFLGGMLADADPLEKLWRVGCYTAVYNTAGAQVLWEHFPWKKVALADTGGVPLAWIQQNWAGLPLRRERRPVRSAAKLHRHLDSLVLWLKLMEPVLYEYTYEELWAALDELYGVGRYMGMRFLEALRLHCGIPARMPDIRPRGGWGSRLTVSFFYPEYDAELNGNDSMRNVSLANELGRHVKDRLGKDGVDVDLYTTETLLCNYRQALTRGKYPGAPHDSELGYIAAAQRFWGAEYSPARAYEARAARFSPLVLGEQRGWAGPRPELGDTKAAHGYWWSDLVYDYTSTRDLAHPVRWPA